MLRQKFVQLLREWLANLQALAELGVLELGTLEDTSKIVRVRCGDSNLLSNSLEELVVEDVVAPTLLDEVEFVDETDEIDVEMDDETEEDLEAAGESEDEVDDAEAELELDKLNFVFGDVLNGEDELTGIA